MVGSSGIDGIDGKYHIVEIDAGYVIVQQTFQTFSQNDEDLIFSRLEV